MWSSWILVAGVALLGLVGFALGRWLSRREGSSWLVAWAVPFLLVLGIALVRNIPSLEFVPPFSWIMAGRLEFALSVFSVTMMLSALGPRLSVRRQEAWLSVLALTCGIYMLLPFLLPPIFQGELSALETQVDPDSVCRQQTNYNCGPAAAVTALRKLGFEAEEGQIAVLAYTNPISGTQCDSLGIALEETYGDRGLECEYRRFETIDEMKPYGAVVTVIKFTFMIDHFVAVLEVGEKHVLLGDPAKGVQRLSRRAFREIWRGRGLALRRTNSQSTAKD
ncbi:MAG: cysteine peptidase family C39 domain-containing protein [Planctomycetota bacterium]